MSGYELNDNDSPVNDISQENRDKSAQALATISMIMGIVSIFRICCCMPFIFSAVGIVLAILSKGASEQLSSQAKTGLVCSIIGMVVSVVLLIGIIGAETYMLTNSEDFFEEFRESYEQQYEEIYGEEVPEEIQELFDRIENRTSE